MNFMALVKKYKVKCKKKKIIYTKNEAIDSVNKIYKMNKQKIFFSIIFFLTVQMAEMHCHRDKVTL